MAQPLAQAAAHPVPPTGRQIKMARAALDWSAHKLAREAGISWRTIQRAETAAGVPPHMNMRTLNKIRATLEAAGIEFLQHRSGFGIKLRSSTHLAS